MVTEFKNLPDNSRIWIYQANRKLSDLEVSEIKEKTREFLSQWTAHGADLEAGYEVKYNRFIVIGLNQSNASASGCSIDASVRFIQSLENAYQVDLLDKMNVTFYNGEFIAHKSLSDFKKMAKARSVSPNTIVFNNLVNTKAEYEEHWKVPAKESWHSRFLA
ncbi:MAG: ABC transporter ATPase [Bacteroidia bacterium]|nr:ABC transporter ATPase [Bacteroidia bacterium]NNF32063.1 ABC transporter ATPase [Flavobacteriaceae bacterium]MBT8277076.1 ABC transporter ATPase [Bacteroidia bacterium]NNJ80554.1 ABC transporter ATPase [Flavobacteriaceae bacterium]NNK52984.1 ABC transporter ATPase [Flavobacteriaceae bacterium]